MFLVGSANRPKETDWESTEELARSIFLARDLKAGHIWVLGDFNYPGFTWEDTLPSIKPDCQHQTMYEEFIEILHEHNLVQMVDKPTRLNNTLDLFLTTNPTLVNKITTFPTMMQSMWMLTSNHKQINKHHEKYTSLKKQTGTNSSRT